MEVQYSVVALKLVIGFITLFLTTKLLGKTMINQLKLFDFVSAIVLSEILGNALYAKEAKAVHIVFALMIWAVLMITVQWVILRYTRLRSFLVGNPSIIIRNGQIDRKQLKKNRMAIDQLASLLRQNNVFSVREVEYAILEPNGQISILKKSKYQNAKVQDFQLPEKPVYLPVTLITDGRVLSSNLHSAGYDEQWLKAQLLAWGISHPEKVLFADWLEGDGIYIVAKN